MVLAKHVALGDVADADVACLLKAQGELSRSYSVPQNLEDGDTSSSRLLWEEGKGLFSKRPEPELTEGTVRSWCGSAEP